MKALIIAAAMTVAFGSLAISARVKKDTTLTKVPVVAGKTMSDADLDKVTAGYTLSIHGRGNPKAHIPYQAYIHGFRGRAPGGQNATAN